MSELRGGLKICIAGSKFSFFARTSSIPREAKRGGGGMNYDGRVMRRSAEGLKEKRKTLKDRRGRAEMTLTTRKHAAHDP